MSCFLEILRCILCCEEDVPRKREHSNYDVVGRSSTRYESKDWSYYPIISTQRPHAALPSVSSSPYQSIYTGNSVIPKAEKLITERDDRKQSPASSASAGSINASQRNRWEASQTRTVNSLNSTSPSVRSAKESQQKRPEESHTQKVPSSPSPSVTRSSVVHSVDGPSGSDLLKPLISPARSESVEKPHAAPPKSIYMGNSVNRNIEKSIGEGEHRNHYPVHSASARSIKESQANQHESSQTKAVNSLNSTLPTVGSVKQSKPKPPEASQTRIVPALPSFPVRNAPIDGPSGLGLPQSLVSSDGMGFGKEAQSKQPRASQTQNSHFSSSTFVRTNNSTDSGGGKTGLGPPKAVWKKKDSLLKQLESSWLQTGHSSPASLVSERISVDPSGGPFGLESSDWEQKSTGKLPVYEIPENIKHLIQMDVVPQVLKKPLSPSTYKDYFAALLYAEDYYTEKWNNFLLTNTTLELDEEWKPLKTQNGSKTALGKDRKKERVQLEKKVYVAFEIESIPERRPYLLSRDFVFVRPSGKDVESFKGVLSKVVKGNKVLVEFGQDFHSQYSSAGKYDVSFSFNRVCLKRTHQAIEAALDPSFRNFLFPDLGSRNRHFIRTSIIPPEVNLDDKQISVVSKILGLKGPPPFIIEESFFIIESLTKTAQVICEAILQIYRIFPNSRILVATPRNCTCDFLASRLNKRIPDMEIFRANAAFRDLEDVPGNIISLSSYDGECFTCPPLDDLQSFKVITSTFISSFRLHSVGITAGHFTHIFTVDASSATEPETMVTLANLADESTVVVVTGCSRDEPMRVRADIARKYGLKKSYFRRLLESKPYSSNDPMFIAHLE